MSLRVEMAIRESTGSEVFHFAEATEQQSEKIL